MTEREIVTITKTCVFCHKPSEVRVYKDQYEAWQHDKIHGGPMRHAQVAFPEMTADDREILISGSHPACFDAAFGGEEED